MSASLVGSEMCIRDRHLSVLHKNRQATPTDACQRCIGRSCSGEGHRTPIKVAETASSGL
eukprot:8810135-Alexandrium_andersonii.AAC.1